MIDEQIPKTKAHTVSVGESVKAMILIGLGYTDRPLYLVAEYLEHVSMERLFKRGLKAEDFTDEILETTTGQFVVNEKKNYKKEVLNYLKSHKDDPLFEKIRKLQLLTKEDISELEQIFWYKVGTREAFLKAFGDCSVVSMLRSVLGIERDAVVAHFSGFLSDGLSVQQRDFVNLVVDYIAENGHLEIEKLLESPFTQWGGFDRAVLWKS
eukprot:TRINITY_DN36193_c0_g1_i1.p2 TRINITY_DN36193_c0_g1~~TRINITY_DN36193_c0_g1_i1.p2  ORF type:complete len:210 (+),score=10.89 TRINITY_DN36193_c0_g1_i1:2-631(+)